MEIDIDKRRLTRRLANDVIVPELVEQGWHCKRFYKTYRTYSTASDLSPTQHDKHAADQQAPPRTDKPSLLCQMCSPKNHFHRQRCRVCGILPPKRIRSPLQCRQLPARDLPSNATSSPLKRSRQTGSRYLCPQCQGRSREPARTNLPLLRCSPKAASRAIR